MKDDFEIFENPHYNEDIEYALKLNRWQLYASACFPATGRFSFFLNIFRRCVNTIYVTCMLILVFPLVCSPIFLDQDTSTSVQDLCIGVLGIAFALKYVVIVLNDKNVQICFDYVYQDWKNIFHGSRDIMLKYAKISRQFAIMIGLSGIMVDVAWQTNAIIRKPIVVDNVTIHFLTFKGDFFIFDGKQDPYFTYVFIFQLITQVIFSIATSSTCIIITFMSHICSQYEILANVITKFGNIANVDIHLINEYYKRIVKKHNKLLR